MIFPHPLFSRKLSFNTLIDLSEKCELPQQSSLPPAGTHATATSPLRIAIVGAGVTGVSTACQIIDAGFDCHIFEAGDVSHIGGIWSQVNDTSSLQIPSSFYKFHPSVEFVDEYPKKAEILSQVQKLWDAYGLAEKSTFNCKVRSTWQEGGKWVINDHSHGYFDGITAAVGTCGDANNAIIPHEKVFAGHIMHSSDLQADEVRGKNVLVVGGGASAVEALEFACDHGAKSVKVLARSEKWFVPRNKIVNAALASCVKDYFGILAWIIEFLLRIFYYRDLWEIAPSFNSKNGIFSSTPICNERVFSLIREGRAQWLRGDILHYTPCGLAFSHRDVGIEAGGPGRAGVEEGDVVILATGFKRPKLDFMPKAIADSPYQAPSWFLQCFATEDASVLATNCTWKDGIASIGGAHINIYTRFQLVFLLDPAARPTAWMMQTWVDTVNAVMSPRPGGTLNFVTLMELYLYFLTFILMQPSLWPHFKFIMAGHGSIAGGPELRNGMPIPPPVLSSDAAASMPTKPAMMVKAM